MIGTHERAPHTCPLFATSVVKKDSIVAVGFTEQVPLAYTLCRRHTGASAAHKPYICERLPVAASWCCTGGLGGCHRQETAPGLEGLVCLCSLWAGRWDRLSGPAPFAIYAFNCELYSVSVSADDNLYSPGYSCSPDMDGDHAHETDLTLYCSHHAPLPPCPSPSTFIPHHL